MTPTRLKLMKCRMTIDLPNKISAGFSTAGYQLIIDIHDVAWLILQVLFHGLFAQTRACDWHFKQPDCCQIELIFMQQVPWDFPVWYNWVHTIWCSYTRDPCTLWMFLFLYEYVISIDAHYKSPKWYVAGCMIMKIWFIIKTESVSELLFWSNSIRKKYWLFKSGVSGQSRFRL